ncbi:MAG: protein-L-isoaspartate(D-aspartate) O-methyltransferase [Pirellulales bacterium]
MPVTIRGTPAVLLPLIVGLLTAAGNPVARGQSPGGRDAADGVAGERMRAARERMVRDDLVAGGITDPRVLDSMRATPRHEFVPSAQRPLAYFDMALPIGEKQTISGIFVVAYMTEKLEPRPTDKVLEIGTGSGYQAAVLAPLVDTVYSIEISKPLGERAARTLARLGYRNVVTRVGDGFAGWAEHAPFDKIIVTCSPEEVPAPLVEQLADGGRMVIPVGERFEQTLVLLTKQDGKLVRDALVPSLFVPMTGTAEENRRVQPDGSRPTVENGGFESLLDGSDVPTAWYYGRQTKWVTAADAPQGERYLRLVNDQPGRPAQIFQGFAVDGRAVSRLMISARLRGEGLRDGLSADEAPALAVQFFDERRSRSSRAFVGPWRGSFDWKDASGSVPVPGWAREAILQVGLLGATGQLDVDDVRLEPVAR